METESGLRRDGGGLRLVGAGLRPVGAGLRLVGGRTQAGLKSDLRQDGGSGYE